MNATPYRLLKTYGIALVVAGGLTWFPYTGFFLSILTDGLLISLICNMFLIHLTFKVLTRRASIGWLVLPVACYGAWLIWLVPQIEAASSEVSKLESDNRVTEPVPVNLTLVFPEGDVDLAKRAKLHLAPSVRVFTGSIELSNIGVAKSGCMLPRSNDPPFIKDKRCPTEVSSERPADAIVFRSLERSDPRPRSGTFLHRYELTQNSAAGDRVVGHFNFGWLSTPVMAPIFQAACVLIDQPSSWSSFMSPKRRKIAVGETGPTDPYDPFHRYTDPVIATLANSLGAKYVVQERPVLPPLKILPPGASPAPSPSDPNDMSRYKD